MPRPVSRCEVPDTVPQEPCRAQVMDREEEVVDVWHEGDVRYERVLNRPDYEKWVPAIGRRYVKPKARRARRPCAARCAAHCRMRAQCASSDNGIVWACSAHGMHTCGGSVAGPYA